MRHIPHLPYDLDDPRRLAAVRSSGLVDAPPDPAFDRATRLTALSLAVPVALVSIVTGDRQFFASQYGLRGPASEDRGTPLSHSFCQHVVGLDRPLVAPDARQHELVADNPAIEALGVAAYLGVPLRDADGVVLGSVCAIDHEPRNWTPRDEAVLWDVAAFLEGHLTMRATTRALLGVARGGGLPPRPARAVRPARRRPVGSPQCTHLPHRSRRPPPRRG